MVHLLEELLLLRQLEMVQESRIHLCQDLELQEVYILQLEVLHLQEQLIAAVVVVLLHLREVLHLLLLFEELLLLRQLEMVQESRIHLCQDLELQEVYILQLEVLHLLLLFEELLLLRQLEMVQESRIHLCQDLELQEVYILQLEVLHFFICLGAG